MAPDRRRRAEILAPAILLAALLVYGCTGIRIVAPGHVVIIQRLGRFEQRHGTRVVHGPGVTFALPYPIDSLHTFSIRRDHAVEVSLGTPPLNDSDSSESPASVRLPSLLLTGDRNLVEVKLQAKYRIVDPHDYLNATLDSAEFIKPLLIASTTRTLSQWRIDEAMRVVRDVPRTDSSDQTQSTPVQLLHEEIRKLVQRDIDLLQAGIEIVSLEIHEVRPPTQVVDSFQQVHTARIDQDTLITEAKSESQETIVEASALAAQIMAEAAGKARLSEAAANNAHAQFQQALQTQSVHGLEVARKLQRDLWARIMSQVGRTIYLPSVPDQGTVRITFPSSKDAP